MNFNLSSNDLQFKFLGFTIQVPMSFNLSSNDLQYKFQWLTI